MRALKISALVAVVALLFALASPPRADALSSEAEVTLIIVGAVAIFVGVVIVGTLLTRDEAKMFIVEPPPPDDVEPGLAFGMSCKMPDGRPALVCW